MELPSEALFAIKVGKDFKETILEIIAKEGLPKSEIERNIAIACCHMTIGLIHLYEIEII